MVRDRERPLSSSILVNNKSHHKSRPHHSSVGELVLAFTPAPRAYEAKIQKLCKDKILSITFTHRFIVKWGRKDMRVTFVWLTWKKHLIFTRGMSSRRKIMSQGQTFSVMIVSH